ncbi:hypothetical protein QT972_10750 [Microcoleus sp. herbarium7]|uniref:hypothetical protein n=1 Tax=Microcoleus sp. herbarium7 TaxID=3055435 RepID=UPI002FD6E1CF
MSQFANWHRKKLDRQNNPGCCDRASRSESSAAADCILGRLAGFSTVFVIKLAGSGLSHQQLILSKVFYRWCDRNF